MAERVNVGVPGLKALVINVDPGNIAAAGELTVNVASPGLGAADRCIGHNIPGGFEAGIYVRVEPFVQAAENIRMVLRNETAAAVDPVAADWTFFIVEG